MQFSQKDYNYSMKNKPIPSEKLYRTTLIEKVELLIKRMRWKAHLFESSEKRLTNPLHYVFRSRNYPPQHKDLIAFEHDLLKLIKSVTFRKVRNIQSKFDIPNRLLNVILQKILSSSISFTVICCIV